MKDKNKIIYRLQPNNSSGRVGKGRGSLVGQACQKVGHLLYV